MTDYCSSPVVSSASSDSMASLLDSRSSDAVLLTTFLVVLYAESILYSLAPVSHPIDHLVGATHNIGLVCSHIQHLCAP